MEGGFFLVPYRARPMPPDIPRTETDSAPAAASRGGGGPPRARQRAVWIISAAMLFVGTLALYREFWPARQAPRLASDSHSVRGAPLFTLYDQHSQIVRLERYIGRHKLLVAFVTTPPRPAPAGSPSPLAPDQPAGESPPESPLLRMVRDASARIQKTGAVLLAVSDNTPWENRGRADRRTPFPFPILSDLDGQTHRQWGAYDQKTAASTEAVYLVDQRGFILHAFAGPDHLETPEEWIRALQKLR